MELRPWDKLLELLPPLASYEFEALKASIAEHGVLQRALVLPDGRIIDGYHRWKVVGDKIPHDTLNLDEQTAFLLGLAMNTARRQMSTDQIKQLRKKQKKIALEMRNARISQEKVAGILGIDQSTIDRWESKGTNNMQVHNTCNPPDLRTKISKQDQERIRERITVGETQTQVAADFKITQQRVSQIAKEEKNKKIEPIAIEIKNDNRLQLIKGDFAKKYKELTPESIDAIITDPPYSEKYLKLYTTLARRAKLLLKDGGSLLVLTGQSYLPEVFRRIMLHLTYHWIVAYLTPGGQSPHLWQKKVNTFWKPVLWFTKGTYSGEWVGDVVRSAVNDNDKTYHQWGQSESGFTDLVKRFTKEGDLILDPFMGAGTTGVVAIHLGRRFIGIDISEEQVAIARGRILRELNETAIPISTNSES